MKAVVVTGAASGFGRGIVSGLLANGFRVIATLRRADERRETFEGDAAKYPGALDVVEVDVTCANDRGRLRALTADTGLFGLVNNAGYGLFGALEDVSEAQIRAQMEVNFFGATLLTQALLPALRASRGFVVNVSSVLGATGFPLTSAYCASKFALEGLSEALRHELAPHGVRVHVVAPGGHRTRFGANLAWGEGKTPAYAGQTKAYKAFQSRLSSGKGTPPDGVVSAVIDLATGRNTAYRVAVGKDARFIDAFRAVVPSRLALGAIGLGFRRLLPVEGPAGGVNEPNEPSS